VPPRPLPRSEPPVKVGVLVDTTEVVLGGTGDYQILNPADGRVLHRASYPGQVVVTADSLGELRIHAGVTEIDGGTTLAVEPATGGYVSIAGRYYRGTALVRPTNPGRLTTINQVDLENYLLGVVPFEIGRVGPELLEAAKAQAVAARTYALRYLGRRDSLGFDVFATVEDQVYGGASGEHEPISQAVRETAGQVLLHDGQLVEAYYHSTCSGQTAAIEEVWPDQPPRPYLVSVLDVNPATGDAFDVTSNRFRWTVTWSADELRQIFNRTLADSLLIPGTDVGALLDLQVLEYTRSGRVALLRITTENATFDVGRDRIRWIFLTPQGPILNSSKFVLRLERDADGRIVQISADGMGWGHGIGMCQVGAMGRARAGQHYQTILQTYYPNTVLVQLY
jgi:stage II sporulation protein D